MVITAETAKYVADTTEKEARLMEVWETFDDLFATLKRQSQRLAELEKRLADVEKRIAHLESVERLLEEVA
jgi:septal ring factor EnvC (AmiA/AmiB activator)